MVVTIEINNIKNIFTFKVLLKQQELKKSIHIHNVAQINMVILNNFTHQSNILIRNPHTWHHQARSFHLFREIL